MRPRLALTSSYRRRTSRTRFGIARSVLELPILIQNRPFELRIVGFDSESSGAAWNRGIFRQNPAVSARIVTFGAGIPLFRREGRHLRLESRLWARNDGISAQNCVFVRRILPFNVRIVRFCSERSRFVPNGAEAHRIEKGQPGRANGVSRTSGFARNQTKRKGWLRNEDVC